MKILEAGRKYSLSIILCMALLLNGGFFDHSVAILGVTMAGVLLWMLFRGDAFYAKDKRSIFWIPTAIFCLSVVVSFWAVDFSENLLGVLRVGVVCMWLWLVRCRGKEEALSARNMLPLLGCATVGISLLSLPFLGIKPFFWENSRMSGFFQYANTNALLMALGILLLIYTWEDAANKWMKVLQLGVLLAGLLLTGSRSVLLLVLLWGCYYAGRKKKFRKPFLIGCGAFGAFGSVFVFVTQNTANVGRIFTIFTSNSTLWGRILYDRDALLYLCRNLLGIGRMGYYYSQGTFQSGVYHIRFVHNDFLQLALDYGVPALVLLLIFLGWQIGKGRQSGKNKELLVFMCLAALVDFHFQYVFMLMTACLFLDYGECIREKKSQLVENYLIFPVLILLFSYVGIATGCGKNGRWDMALSMLPDYTYAQEKMILSTMGTPQSYEMATRLSQKNPYNITAAIGKGTFLASQLATEECMEAFDRVLELDPYNAENYKQYELMLQNMIRHLEAYEDESLTEELRLLQNRKAILKSELEKQKERTSKLAYRIKDKPVFEYE